MKIKTEYLEVKGNLIKNKKVVPLLDKWKLKIVSENHLQGVVTDIVFEPDKNITIIKQLWKSIVYTEIPMNSFSYMMNVGNGYRKLKKIIENADPTLDLKIKIEEKEGYVKKSFIVQLIVYICIILLIIICTMIVLIE